MAARRSFHRWLKAQLINARLDDVGRLAALALKDKHWPKGAENHDEVLQYLRDHKAIDPMLKAFERAWREWLTDSASG
jgi:uncharacterized protein YozE (UPF0346 family)